MIALLAIVTLLIMAGGAFVGANFCEPGGGAQQALLGLGGALVGMILPSIPAFLQGVVGKASSIKPTGPGGVAALVLAGSLLLAGGAHGQPRTVQALGCVDTANTYCVVPAAAVGWQVNLKTGGAANAVSLVGLTMQHTFGSLPVGLGLYVGLGASNDNRGSYQGCIGVSITIWGLVCGGAQRIVGEPVWQGMLTFAPQLTFGGTPSYVQGAR